MPVRRRPRQCHFTKRSVTLVQGVATGGSLEFLVKKGAKNICVLEGRPSLEAGRHMCRTLIKRNEVPTVIADNMAGFLFYKGYVKEVWLAYTVFGPEGAVCDIGALIMAVLARQHGVPVRLIPGRISDGFIADESQLLTFGKERIAPTDVRAYVPLKDWVPVEYISEVFA